MAKDKFVEDDFQMVGSDAEKIRKLLRIHPRREIPAKIVKRYRSIYHMTSHIRNSFTRDMLQLLCAMCCKVTRGKLNGESVILVDGENLSVPPEKPKADESQKKE